MIFKTDWDSFDALLRSKQGEELAAGSASVSVPQGSVTFESDFVPLYPMGTPMEIVRLHGGQPIHRFMGRVYLSDKKLMRLVSVEDELLPGAEYFYNDHMELPAMLTVQTGKPERKKRMFRRQPENTGETERSIAVSVTGLTDQRVAFQLSHPSGETEGEKRFWTHAGIAAPPVEIKEKQRFRIAVDSPLYLRAQVEVAMPFYFGEAASYICDFVALPEETKGKIRDFLWRYTLAHHKLF